jgi:Heparinase II/III N-terminus/Heparinase II/III-like protein
MKLISKTKRVLRGDVDVRTAASEALRQVNMKLEQRRERASLASLNQQPARLREEFARVRASDLLAHFHSRTRPKFFPGFDILKRTASLQTELFPAETARLIEDAQRITRSHCWPLLGFGEKCFGDKEVNWNRDPLSGFQWPLDYHADIALMRNDGSDARVVWELNRLAHLITLGRAFAITEDKRFSSEFIRQLQSWREQNPVGRGVNWNCAMEVALRALNLLAAFSLFLRSSELDEFALKEILALLDQHGVHIRRHLEFSHIATSNHYLADITGLLWLGVMLPELQAAEEWREFGLRELLGEMDKQVLPDGVDYEASTGYHRLKVELFLYSFVLCHLNGIDIQEKYWTKLRAMIEYIAAYLRPDGRAPLIGDSDSGQVLPIKRRGGDDHAYVAALGAAIFQEPHFKLGNEPVAVEELLWILGERGVRDYEALAPRAMPVSRAFPNAGVYLLRHNDLYLHFNAGAVGVNGRGSHGHNDALSIEVAAKGTAFIVDPGSYLYTANLAERHLFRSTASHSTIEIDGVEQNTIDKATPFIIGNEAQPRVISWETNDDFDQVIAEHYGYRRLPQPVTHRRTVFFAKVKRFWRLQDELEGEGLHDLKFRFHLRPGLAATISDDETVAVCDKMTRERLLISCHEPDGNRGQNLKAGPVLEARFSSNDYGHKEASISVCWAAQVTLPFSASFFLLPVSANEDETERLEHRQ